MEACIEGAENVAAVELSGGQEIQRSGEKADPCGAADWRKEEEVGIDAGMKSGVEKAEKQRSAEDDAVLGRIGKSDSGNDARM